MHGTTKKKLYVIRDKKSRELVFIYRTNNYNAKKALFRSTREAQDAVKLLCWRFELPDEDITQYEIEEIS